MGRPFRLLGWLGSDDLIAITRDLPCGCELLEDASKETDPISREARESDAKHWQDQWRCPCSGRYPWPKDQAVLSPEAQEVFEGVERLIGASLPIKTCPNAHGQLRCVHEANKARAWAERGHVSAKTPAVILDAIEQIDRGVNARTHADTKRLKEKKPAK